jgi:hypothetical protein
LFSFEFLVSNNADYLGRSDDLTDLSILDISFSGANADLFSVSNLRAGVILGEQEEFAFNIDFLSNIAQDISAQVTFKTDQLASLGENGLEFVFDLSATVLDTEVVSVPRTLGIFGLSILALGYMRRRSKQR